MKKIRTLAFLLILGLFSCSINSKSKESQSDKQENIFISDTIKKIVVDNYPVENSMFIDKTNKNFSYKKQSGSIFSHNKVWFSNDTLKQVLVFELYTDYHRLVTYHFYSEDIPADLIKTMELHLADGKLASEQQKLNDFEGFLEQTIKTNSLYFTSKKGFKLDDAKQKAIDVYGKPDNRKIVDDVEKLEWSFIGDALYDDKNELSPKAVAQNSFGYRVVMYFKNEKLIAQILYNAIP